MGLVFQGLAQLGIALLDLLEQSYILDGDDGLVRECLEKSDLFVAERPDFCAANNNGSNSFIFPQQGCNRHSASARTLLEESRFWKLRLKFSRDVVDVDCRPVDHGPSCWVAST